MPGLAVVIVGCRKDSQSYVNMKRKACAEVGIKSVDIDLPENVSQDDLIAKVHELNADPDVHGWLHNHDAHSLFFKKFDCKIW